MPFLVSIREATVGVAILNAEKAVTDCSEHSRDVVRRALLIIVVVVIMAIQLSTRKSFVLDSGARTKK